jgi:hypothetical protein
VPSVQVCSRSLRFETSKEALTSSPNTINVARWLHYTPWLVGLQVHTPLVADLLTVVLNLTTTQKAVAPDIILRNVNRTAYICTVIHRLLGR